MTRPKPNTASSLAALAAKIALGVVLVVIAVRHHRRMGQAKPRNPPKWQAHVDSMSPWFALGLAPALQPWVLIGAGAATVVEARLRGPHALGERSVPGPVPDLDRCPHRPGDHLGSLIIGLWLIANSIYLIVT